MFPISSQYKHVFIKGIMTFINLSTTQFQAYTYLGSENIYQIYIDMIVMFYQAVSIDHAD